MGNGNLISFFTLAAKCSLNTAIMVMQIIEVMIVATTELTMAASPNRDVKY